MRASDANQEFVSSGAECQPVKDGVRRQRPRAAGRNRVLGSQDRASGTRQHGHHGPPPVVVPDSHRDTGGTPTGDWRDRDRRDLISRPKSSTLLRFPSARLAEAVGQQCNIKRASAPRSSSAPPSSSAPRRLLPPHRLLVGSSLLIGSSSAPRSSVY
ncbi:unnamed protein product [Arctogadus glacialis]